jgi:transcriptional regulator with XRE-family HTH domain
MEINFNQHLGSKLRMRRLALGLTQTKVALAINVTFQQIQKYENGISQISATKLYKLYRFFEIPLEYFFDKRLIENQNFTKLIKNVQQNNL